MNKFKAKSGDSKKKDDPAHLLFAKGGRETGYQMRNSKFLSSKSM